MLESYGRILKANSSWEVTL